MLIDKLSNSIVRFFTKLVCGMQQAVFFVIFLFIKKGLFKH